MFWLVTTSGGPVATNYDEIISRLEELKAEDAVAFADSVEDLFQQSGNGRTEALEQLAVEMLARGLSVRDIEDAFRSDDGQLLFSRTAVSELGEQLWRDYQDFATRDLSEHEIIYLFVDGIAERIRPGQRREPVMAAWGVHCHRRQGAAAPDGRFEGGRRDRLRVLLGHARPRAR